MEVNSGGAIGGFSFLWMKTYARNYTVTAIPLRCKEEFSPRWMKVKFGAGVLMDSSLRSRPVAFIPFVITAVHNPCS